MACCLSESRWGARGQPGVTPQPMRQEAFHKDNGHSNPFSELSRENSLVLLHCAFLHSGKQGAVSSCVCLYLTQLDHCELARHP